MNNPLRLACLALCSGMAFTAAAADPGNLLLNPSFEYETAGDFHAGMFWVQNQPDRLGDTYGSARRENWRAQDGFYAMAIRGTWAGAGDSGGVWREVPAIPGTTYRFTAWTWADAVWSASTRELKIEFWNADRSRPLASTGLSLDDTGESWQETSLENVAPDGSAWVRAVIHVAGAGPEGALLVDSLTLRSGTAP
jgi:hypothetical protein